MEEFTTARINSKMLSMYCGRSVLLVGKVTTKSETEALLESSDHGQIKVYRNQMSNWDFPFVEVTGIVNDDLSIQEQAAVPLNESFDLENYDKMITIAQKFNNLHGWCP